MGDSKDIARKANEKIVEWVKETPKLVVAVDGYTGVGKSTLLKNLIELNPDILEVNRDDFIVSREETRRALANTEDKSKFWELEVCRNGDLERLTRAFKEGKESFTAKTFNPKSGNLDIVKTFDISKKILVIEGVICGTKEYILRVIWLKMTSGALRGKEKNEETTIFQRRIPMLTSGTLLLHLSVILKRIGQLQGRILF